MYMKLQKRQSQFTNVLLRAIFVQYTCGFFCQSNRLQLANKGEDSTIETKSI